MTRSRMRRLAALAAAAALALPALAACGNVAETAAENAAEQVAEDIMGGGDVEIDDNSMTVTDAEGNEMAVGEGISVPDTWPSDVPLYDGGELSMVTVQADGSAYAMWTLSGDPAGAMDAYTALLEDAGYSMEQDADLGGTLMREFRNADRTVSVVAGEGEGMVTLNVTAVTN